MTAVEKGDCRRSFFMGTTMRSVDGRNGATRSQKTIKEGKWESDDSWNSGHKTSARRPREVGALLLHPTKKRPKREAIG